GTLIPLGFGHMSSTVFGGRCQRAGCGEAAARDRSGAVRNASRSSETHAAPGPSDHRLPATVARRGAGMLRVEELDRLLVDLHVLAVGDGRRLGRAHEMAPAPRKASGVELLEGGLMVLEGVHLGEVVVR